MLQYTSRDGLCDGCQRCWLSDTRDGIPQPMVHCPWKRRTSHQGSPCLFCGSCSMSSQESKSYGNSDQLYLLNSCDGNIKWWGRSNINRGSTEYEDLVSSQKFPRKGVCKHWETESLGVQVHLSEQQVPFLVQLLVFFFYILNIQIHKPCIRFPVFCGSESNDWCCVTFNKNHLLTTRWQTLEKTFKSIYLDFWIHIR